MSDDGQDIAKSFETGIEDLVPAPLRKVLSSKKTSGPNATVKQLNDASDAAWRKKVADSFKPSANPKLGQKKKATKKSVTKKKAAKR